MQHHSGNYTYICKICQRGFSKQRDLHEHVMKHEGKTFTCHICQKTFSSPRNLERHMKCHTAADKETQ